MNYWINAYGWNVGLRIIVARAIGPVIWPAWYIVPSRIRDKWHRIACDDEACECCRLYYEELEREFNDLYYAND